MTLPFREFTDLITRGIKCESNDNTCDSVGDYTTDVWEYARVGHQTFPAGVYHRWQAVIKSASMELETSLDQCVDYGADFQYVLDVYDSVACTTFLTQNRILRRPDAPDTWIPKLVNGKYYDGVNPWGGYPLDGGYSPFENVTITIANLPYTGRRWVEAYHTGHRGNQYQETFFRNGMLCWITNYAGCATPFASPGRVTCFLTVNKFHVNYLNPVVNSISRRWMLRGESPAVVLQGLGFNQANAELSDPARYSFNAPATNWNSIVDRIFFEGQQGQGTFTLTRVAGDFNVNSDTRITIPVMPNLPIGTYHIRLRKDGVGVGAGINVDSYAGDWEADSDGRCSPASRFSFLVTDKPPKNEGSMILTKWGFRKGDLQIWKHYAPIDVQSTETFYSGRILSVSNMTKAVDNNSGIPNISDMNVELANNDKEFSKLLAEYMCDDQIVEIFHAWRMSPESWKTSQIRMIIDDWTLQGTSWHVLLKDVTQKYFQTKVPRYMITEEEFPNLHESARGKGMPEAIGKCYLTGETPGAIEAYLVDTTTHEYLALRGSAHAITQVYSNGSLKATPADYSIVYKDGGRTYIDFVADQGDNKITFNCEGYMLADWNSANGYVQNPAYVIAFLIALLAEVPADFIDLSSIDTLATLFEELGWDENGYLILQDFQGMDAVLAELLFTYGVKSNIDKLGRLRFERKDKTNYATDILIFDQIDCIGSPSKSRNRRQAFNRVQSQSNYYPTASLYLGSNEDQRDAAIEDFGVEIFPSGNPWKFQWTDSTNVPVVRLSEELSRRSYGDKKCSLSVPIDWIDTLDILTNFMLQDLFGLNPSGDGEERHYYYVENLSIDFQNAKMDIIAADLQWLVRTCLILGKYAELNRNYNNASEWQKTFAYIGRCLEGTFANGDPNKQICKCG